MSMTTDLQAALAAEGSTIRAAWIQAVRNNTNPSPKAYAHTHALEKALNLDATLRSIKVLEVNGTFRIVGYIVLSGSLVLEAHKASQVPLISLGKTATYKVRHQLENPKTLGVIGSMQPEKVPYLLAYLAAGPNAPGQPLVYRYLGQPPTRTSRVPNKSQIIADFAKLLGFTLEGTPTGQNIYGGTVRLQDTGKSIIKTAVQKAIGSK